MAINDFSFSISYEIHFASVPEGAEDFADLVISNVEQMFESHSDDFISDAFNDSSLSEAAIQQTIESRVAAECALEASVAQNEHWRHLLAELTDSCYVTVTMSDTMDDLMHKIEEEIEAYVSSAIGGG